MMKTYKNINALCHPKPCAEPVFSIFSGSHYITSTLRTILLMVFLCLGVSTVTSAQNTKAVLQFKDGTTKTGLGKIVGNEVKFRTKKKEKLIRYHFSDLEQVKMYYDLDEPTTYVYIKVQNYKGSLVLQLILEGKVDLYQEVTIGYNAGFMNNGFGENMTYSGAGYTYDINNYYVKKESEIEAFHLGSNLLFTKNFKQAASGFFKDCSELVKKIEDEEFKKKQLKEIVEFYNNQCN